MQKNIIAKINPLPTLKTPRLIIRPFESRDISEITNAFLEKSVTDFLLIVDCDVAMLAETFVTEEMEKYSESRGTVWAICNSDNVCIGSICLQTIDDIANSCEIGYWLAKSAQGKGYGSEAVGAIVHYCFNNLGIHKLTAKCRLDNKPSLKLLKKAGFTIEGLFKDAVYFKDRYLDIVYLGKINDE